MFWSLDSATWDYMPSFQPVVIDADRRLSAFLKSATDKKPGSNNQTVGEWVMTYMPRGRMGTGISSSSSLEIDQFLTRALGPTYTFDMEIAAIFHRILLSSLQAYLCLLTLLHYYMEKEDNMEMLAHFATQFESSTLCYIPMQ
jgi:hypothetical protein